MALEKGYHPVTVSAYTFLFACVGVLPFLNPGSLLEKMNKEPSAWLWVLAMALISTCMAFTLYQENLSPVMILGIALVLISSIIINK